MKTPLYNTDIIPLTSRPTLTVMDDGDYFAILDTSTGKISKILKTNIMTALKITYDNTTSGLTAETVQAALDELVVNLGSSDSTILALAGRLDTLEGTGAGSVKKAIDDAVSPLAEVVDTNRLYSDSQYLALKAKADSLQIKCNTLQAEVYTDDPILQYGAVEIIGKGYEADNTPIDVSSNVVDGSLALEQKGLTITNLVPNGITFTDWQSVTSVSDGWARKTSTAGVIGSIATPSTLPITIVEGHKYAVRIKVRINDGFDNVANKYLTTRFGANLSGYNFATLIGTTTTSYADATILEFTVIVTATSAHASGNGMLYLLAYNESNAIDVAWAKPMVTDLTAHGLDHITDTAILAKLLPYVDGTKNVGKLGVRVVGRNILPPNYFIDGYRLGTDGSVIYNNSYIGLFSASPVYIPVVPNSHYTINRRDSSRACAFYDRNRNFIEFRGPDVFWGYTNLTPANCYYIRMGFNYLASQQEDLYMVRTLTRINVEDMPPYEPYQEQLTFLPAIGNSLPNGVADSVKTVADGWEHTKRMSTPASVASGVAVNTTNYPTAKNGGQWVNELTAGGTEIGVVGTDSTTGAGMLRFELATPIVTKYDLPLPTSGKTIHRFAGEEKISLYGTGLTFSENVLSVLSAVKFVAGEMTDITDLATITTNTVTFTGVSATDVVYVKVEHDVNRPLGVLEHTPAVSNTASRLAALEAAVFGG